MTVAGLIGEVGDFKKFRTQSEIMKLAFSENSKASAQLKKLEEVYDGVFGKEPLQGPGEEYDKLLEEMRKMKKEGRKPH